MLKKTFTIAEAAAWLSSRLAEPITEADVIREAAESRLPICFNYRGNIAIYPRPSAVPSISWAFPKAISKHYFVGLLRSKSPVQLGSRVESISLRLGPDGRPTRCATVDYVDILYPNHVEIATLLHADPPFSVVDPNRFVARCDQYGNALYLQVPKRSWIFYIDDLLTLVANQNETPATISAQQFDEASRHNAAAKSASGPTSEVRPDKYPDDGTLDLKWRERQIRRVEWAAKQLGFTPTSVPDGGKADLQKFCMEEFPTYFPSENSFRGTWKDADRKRLRMANHKKYDPKGG